MLSVLICGDLAPSLGLLVLQIVRQDRHAIASRHDPTVWLVSLLSKANFNGIVVVQFPMIVSASAIGFPENAAINSFIKADLPERGS
ncbi:hypothetical protein [Propionivibrio sp.]|uniref:hypothetical protein n=1 Tax=Propionivibrio sp. TaxID=2212460 RepID=UPI002607A79B|nr:hypothetical protein [Propionivibrio sp.]